VLIAADMPVELSCGFGPCEGFGIAGIGGFGTWVAFADRLLAFGLAAFCFKRVSNALAR